MIAWRIAASVWLFRWIFRDPKVDLRFLMAGVVLPDAIDLLVGTLLFPRSLALGELWAHSLLAPTLMMVVVLLTTRRGRRRRAWMALTIGWLFHLLIDGMWMDGGVFFWPFFGFEIPAGQSPFWPMAWERALGDPWRWLLEAVGVGYLIWLWRRAGLQHRENRRALLATGRLRSDVES